MTPQMVETLVRISLLYAPEPETVFQEIVETISAMYGNTMAMVNLVEGECLRARTVVNSHSAFTNIRALDMRVTLCQFALRSGRPLLIQNAKEHPDFRRHLVIRLKLRRYLGVPISDSAGKMIGTLCFLDDRTDEPLGEEDIQFLSVLAMRVSAELERERLIEARLAEQRDHAAQLEARLELLGSELREAQEKLVETAQMRAVGTLAMGIAYDLRNILTTLRLEMAALEAAPYQESASKQMDRLYALTHSLLALSEEVNAEFSPVDVSEIIDFVFRLLAGQAEVDGVRLCKLIQRPLPFALGSPRRLEHLFVNLLLNALNAVAAAGGTVTVAIRQEKERVRVDVRDTGPGISQENQPRIFEPFFTTRANRTGLGLFSARRIVEAHQGQIEIVSEPGKGTCVSVWLPAAETPD